MSDRPKHDMSCSQWGKWKECPAAAYAQYVLHEYRPAPTKPMAIGAMVDAILTESAAKADDVLEKYAAFLLTKKGEQTADCRRALEWARVASEHPMMRKMMHCAETQVELTGEIGGVEWLAYIDILKLDLSLICDVKTTADIHKEEWVPRLRKRGSWIARWGYGYQLALYLELARQNYTDQMAEWIGAILAIGKRTLADGTACPDIACYQWEDSVQLDCYLGQLARSMNHPHDRWDGSGDVFPPIMEMKEQDTIDGLPRCEACDWCVQTRKPDTVWMYADPAPRTWRM